MENGEEKVEATVLSTLNSLPTPFQPKGLRAPGRIRTCTNLILSQAPQPLGYRSDLRSWTTEGIEPSFPGCRPGVFPLDDGPFRLAALAQGGPFDSRSLAHGRRLALCRGKESNLHPRPSESRALVLLSYRNQSYANHRASCCPLSIAPCTGQDSNLHFSA